MAAVYKNPAFAGWISAAALPWRAAACRRFTEVRNGGTPSSQAPEFWGGDIMWVTPDDLGKIDGKTISDSQRTITDEGVAGSNAVLVPTGSILLSTRAPIGHVAIAARETAFNQGCRAIVPTPANYRSDYLYYYAVACRPVLVASGNGTTFKELSWEELASLPLPLVPLEEQEAISCFLDRETARIDALIGKKRRLLDLLGEKRLAVITHAVTKGLDPNAPMKDSGIDWLGQIPAHWGVKRLKQLVREGSSISYGIVQPGPHQQDGVPFVQTTDLVRGRLSPNELQRTTEEIAAQYPRSRLTPGDVLLGIRASVGDTCVVTPELGGANLSRGIARIVPGPSVTAAFLSLCLMSDYVYSYWMLAQQGSTFREVSIESVKELPLAIPPLTEQKSILAAAMDKVKNIESAKELAACIIDRLQEYRSALITNAVTGKIDVRHEVA